VQGHCVTVDNPLLRYCFKKPRKPPGLPPSCVAEVLPRYIYPAQDNGSRSGHDAWNLADLPIPHENESGYVRTRPQSQILVGERVHFSQAVPLPCNVNCLGMNVEKFPRAVHAPYSYQELHGNSLFSLLSHLLTWTVLCTQKFMHQSYGSNSRVKKRIAQEDGTIAERYQGTPQGGVVSPVLANVFLHYAFDLWMERTHPNLPWCRYADDGLVHCRSEQEAQALKAELQARLAECYLELHPTKTRIVYCKNRKRKGKYPNVKFDFLGYCFWPRRVQKR
jgi:hypothetical protein